MYSCCYASKERHFHTFKDRGRERQNFQTMNTKTDQSTVLFLVKSHKTEWYFIHYNAQFTNFAITKDEGHHNY